MPTITLEGGANGSRHPESSAYATKFTGKYTTGDVGNNLPQEAPRVFAQAVLDVTGY